MSFLIKQNWHYNNDNKLDEVKKLNHAQNCFPSEKGIRKLHYSQRLQFLNYLLEEMSRYACSSLQLVVGGGISLEVCGCVDIDQINSFLMAI